MSEIIVVASGKGGVGKSTIVSSLANELAFLNKKVLCIDCDIALRSLDILLECSDSVVFDWGDIISENCEPHEAIIEGYVDFIAAPSSFDENQTPENFKKIIAEFKDKYDYILLDAPAGIDRGFEIPASAADKAIVVSTPDSVCVRSCNRAVVALRSLGVDNIRLVINMFDSKNIGKCNLINVDGCIDQTNTQLLGVVPYDRDIAFSSVNGKKPGEFSSSTQAFIRIAKRIEGQNEPLFF